MVSYRIIVPLPPKSLCYTNSPLSPPKPLATIDHFTVSIILPFPECHRVRTIQYVIISNWLLPFSLKWLISPHMILKCQGILVSGNTTKLLYFFPEIILFFNNYFQDFWSGPQLRLCFQHRMSKFDHQLGNYDPKCCVAQPKKLLRNKINK